MTMGLLVVGDYISDVYTFGTATRLCPEAPVPVLIPEVTRVSAGGAGLVYSQLVKLGADVTPLYLSHSEKHRYFAGSHLICRVDHDSISKSDRHFSNLQPFAGFDAIVVSDYGKGAMTRELAQAIVSTGKPCFVDAKNHWDWYAGKNVTIFPNHIEAKPVRLDKFTTIRAVGGDLYRGYDFGCIVNKMGKDGARLNDATHQDFDIPATVSEVVDTCGAGDVFMASFVYAWTLQLPPEDCLRFANELAGESCRHRGTFVVGKEFAQSVLDRLRASARLQQQIPDCSLDSNWSSIPPKHIQNHVEAIAAETLANNPHVDYVQVLGGPAEGQCNFPVAQIRRKSPSVPTESTDTQTPSDQGIAGVLDSESRSEQPSQNSTETEHQCEHTLGPDQGWIG